MIPTYFFSHIYVFICSGYDIYVEFIPTRDGCSSVLQSKLYRDKFMIVIRIEKIIAVKVFAFKAYI